MTARRLAFLHICNLRKRMQGRKPTFIQSMKLKRKLHLLGQKGSEMVNRKTLDGSAGVQLDFGFAASAPEEEPTFLKTPLDWFESWLDYRSSTANRLSPEAAEPYRYIWAAWCKWLLCQAEDKDWAASVLAASPSQAMDFLAGQVKPANQRAGSATEISIVTRERYCMVLREIYAHLERQGLIKHNPMRRLYALAGDDRPDAEIVPEQVYDWLCEKFISLASTSPFEVRDRALMLLMLDQALTPGELAALRVVQISEDAEIQGYWFSIEGGRAAQRRQLRVDGPVALALMAWLQLRSHLLTGAATHMAEAEDLVFFTERRRPLSRRVLFHLTSGEIAAACSALELPLPRHLGPLVLRNTAILGWIRQGMPAEEVCRRAGYQGAVSLEHLRAYLD